MVTKLLPPLLFLHKTKICDGYNPTIYNYKMLERYSESTSCYSQLKTHSGNHLVDLIPGSFPAALPVGLVIITGATSKVQQDPSLQVSLDVLLLSAAAISSQQI